MKFILTLKDPDGVYESLKDAGLDLNELGVEIEEALDKFVEWNEYVTVEIDSDTMTARVIPVNE